MDPQEIEVGLEGVWISIAGKSVKVRVIDGSLEIDVWDTGKEDSDDHWHGDLSVPLT